jgi:hypothetical protein
MDPQKLSQIDPKLKEVYDKVMGAPDPSQVQTPPPANPILAPQPIPQPQTATQYQQEASPQSQSVFTPQQTLNTPSPQPTTTIPQDSNPTQLDSEIATSGFSFIPSYPIATSETLATKKKGVSGKFILLGLVVIVFIAVYALFRAKALNINLPFLH